MPTDAESCWLHLHHLRRQRLVLYQMARTRLRQDYPDQQDRPSPQGKTRDQASVLLAQQHPIDAQVKLLSLQAMQGMGDNRMRI